MVFDFLNPDITSIFDIEFMDVMFSSIFTIIPSYLGGLASTQLLTPDMFHKPWHRNQTWHNFMFPTVLLCFSYFLNSNTLIMSFIFGFIFGFVLHLTSDVVYGGLRKYEEKNFLESLGIFVVFSKVFGFV